MANKYELTLDRIVQKYKAALDEEDVLEINDGSLLEEEEAAESLNNFVSLAELSFSKIQQLRVSKISLFQDNIWDWRQEGSPIYKNSTFFSWDKEISTSVSLLDWENRFLYLLLKMIEFYSLPQNTLQNVKSYNTSKRIAERLIILGKFLYKNRVFIDTQGTGLFNTTQCLTTEHFIDFIDNDLENHYEKYAFSRQVRYWRVLSQNKLIPEEFRLEFEPIDTEMYSNLFKNAEENKGAYLPISFDTLSKLVPLCINTIEECSEEILKIYSVLWPIFAGGEAIKESSFEWCNAIDKLLNMKLRILDLNAFRFSNYDEVEMSNELKKRLLYAIRSHPTWNESNPLYVSAITSLCSRKVLEIASVLNIDLDTVDKSFMYDIKKIIREVSNLVIELRNSCVVILFLVTGMRRSEMFLLEAGNCWHVKGSEDDFRIKVTVSKTSDGSSGDIVILPVPKIAFSAFKCLESLTEKPRTWGKTNRLMVTLTAVFFGKEIIINSINNLLTRWCEDLDIEHIHPHQFRKTIAMFAMHQNHNNIGLIKRLFSHKSLAMTLAYIIKMPGMNKEIKLAIIEQNKHLLIELIEAIDKKCVGGKAGNRIKKVIDESDIFKASLQDDGWENLEQYTEILLQDGLNILHRTSFGAICTNTHSGLVHLGPETCNCNVVDCDWAVFTENSIDDIENDIRFHKELLAKNLHSEEQMRFSVAHIKSCIDRLCELKGRDVISKQYPELMNVRA